jgi:hypothetical protein
MNGITVEPSRFTFAEPKIKVTVTPPSSRGTIMLNQEKYYELMGSLHLLGVEMGWTDGD